jgi:polyphenol oxidase
MSQSIYQFEHFSNFPELQHGIAPRSVDKFSKFNMSFQFQDEVTVKAHRQHVLKMTGEGLHDLIGSYQTHSDHILIHRSGDVIPTDEPHDYDAFVSDAIGVGFIIKTADCQPVLMYDPIKRAVGLVHSGWKGSLKNVIGKTVKAMVKTFDSNPQDIRVGIGPSLGPCCAEFSDPKNELNEAALNHLLPENKVDFWKLTREQLNAEGVINDHIQFSYICTVCSKDQWFSYRGDQPDEGRFGSVIGLV